MQITTEMIDAQGLRNDEAPEEEFVNMIQSALKAAAASPIARNALSNGISDAIRRHGISISATVGISEIAVTCYALGLCDGVQIVETQFLETLAVDK